MGVHGYCLPSKTIVNEELILTESIIDTKETKDSGDIKNEKTDVKSEKNNSQQSLNSKNENDEENNGNKLYLTAVMDGYTRGESVVRDRFKETVKNKDRQMQEIRDKNALLPGSDLPGFIPLRYVCATSAHVK